LHKDFGAERVTMVLMRLKPSALGVSSGVLHGKHLFVGREPHTGIHAICTRCPSSRQAPLNIYIMIMAAPCQLTSYVLHTEHQQMLETIPAHTQAW